MDKKKALKVVKEAADLEPGDPGKRSARFGRRMKLKVGGRRKTR